MGRFLSPEEHARLAEQVAEVERRTAGEIVTVVIDRGASYAAYRIGWAGALALGLVSVAHLIWPALTPVDLLGGQAAIAMGLYALLGVSPLLRAIVPRPIRELAVSARVRQLFVELGVTETRDRSGVLVVLSELERRVEILADRGIHEQVGTEVWQRLVADLVSAIHGGRAADGLSRVIDRIGQELAAKFPRRADDQNELPDGVVEIRR
jgi:putative membrane protein